jgi:hypothetical protein
MNDDPRMPYRDLAAALERIERLEAELEALKRPRRRLDWFIVALRIAAWLGLFVTFSLFAWFG